uniref:Uncharacterized protein n=1 Tax=Setaria digitata TaxID=48799 RepID=A0A915PGR4_9BILA
MIKHINPSALTCPPPHKEVQALLCAKETEEMALAFGKIPDISGVLRYLESETVMLHALQEHAAERNSPFSDLFLEQISALKKRENVPLNRLEEAERLPPDAIAAQGTGVHSEGETAEASQIGTCCESRGLTVSLHLGFGPSTQLGYLFQFFLLNPVKKGS